MDKYTESLLFVEMLRQWQIILDKMRSRNMHLCNHPLKELSIECTRYVEPFRWMDNVNKFHWSCDRIIMIDFGRTVICDGGDYPIYVDSSYRLGILPTENKEDSHNLRKSVSSVNGSWSILRLDEEVLSAKRQSRKLDIADLITTGTFSFVFLNTKVL